MSRTQHRNNGDQQLSCMLHPTHHTTKRKGQTTNYGSQILIVWSTLPVATTLIIFSASTPFACEDPAPLDLAALSPSDVFAVDCRPQASEVMKCECASFVVFTQRPVDNSHTRIVLSSDAERRNFPVGWKTIARIQLSCPS